MKKSCIISCLLAGFLMIFQSCDDNYESLTPIADDVRPADGTRSMNEILTIARDAASRFGDPKSRSANYRYIDPAQKPIARYGNASRSGGASPLFYVVNYADNMGYAVVTADTCAQPLLAVTESGNLDPNNVDPKFGGLKIFLEAAEDYCQSVQSGIEKPTPDPGPVDIRCIGTIGDTIVYKTDLSNTQQLMWGQENPFGSLCSNGKAGCGPISLALLMAHYEQPKTIESAYFGETINLDWSELKKHIHKDLLPDAVNPNYILTTLAKLGREVGYRSNANYKSDATSTSMNNLRNTIMQLGYNVSNVSYQVLRHTVYYSLKENKCVIMAGYPKDAEDKGHVWFIDGVDYLYIWRDTYNYRPLKENITDGILIDSYSREESFSHINWGWDGLNNGWFDLVFCPNDAHEYDDNNHNVDTESTRYSYNYSLQYFDASYVSLIIKR